MASPSDVDGLRERGIVAYSGVATRCMSAAALLLCIAILWSSFQDTPLLIRQFFSYTGTPSGKDCRACLALRDRILALLLIIPFVMLLAAVIIGLFQTKFLFYWSNLGFDLSKLNQAKMFSIEAVALRIAKAFLVGGILLVTWLAVLSQGVGVVAGLLNGDRAHFMAWPQHAGKTFMPIAAFFLALLGFMCWISARVIFLYQHRANQSGLTRDLYQDE